MWDSDDSRDGLVGIRESRQIPARKARISADSHDSHGLYFALRESGNPFFTI